jgi:hypothetical protein
MMRATALFAASVAFAAADEWRALVVGDWGGASKSPYVVSVLPEPIWQPQVNTFCAHSTASATHPHPLSLPFSPLVLMSSSPSSLCFILTPDSLSPPSHFPLSPPLQTPEQLFVAHAMGNVGSTFAPQQVLGLGGE